MELSGSAYGNRVLQFASGIVCRVTVPSFCNRATNGRSDRELRAESGQGRTVSLPQLFWQLIPTIPVWQRPNAAGVANWEIRPRWNCVIPLDSPVAGCITRSATARTSSVRSVLVGRDDSRGNYSRLPIDVSAGTVPRGGLPAYLSSILVLGSLPGGAVESRARRSTVRTLDGRIRPPRES